MYTPRHEASPLKHSDIDDLSHILTQGAAQPDTDNFNGKLEVFRTDIEGDRARVYQMWAIDKFASNPVASEALRDFGLAGTPESAPDKENWTQLLEHVSGVNAIANHLATLIETHGGQSLSRDDLNTATLLHDIEKPAEIAAARELAMPGQASAGLENSLDNPVLRDGRIWRWSAAHGVSDEVIMAAQNTGRGDRFYSDISTYEAVVDAAVEAGTITEINRGAAIDNLVKKADTQRSILAGQLNTTLDEINTMTPSERRRASIEAKGSIAAVVGISDALAVQFRFKDITPAGIDKMSAHYLTYKKDPESVAFFGEDWPQYYKDVREYLISLAPEANQTQLAHDLDTLTHQQIFNETVLPTVLGAATMERAAAQHQRGEANIYDELSYR